MTDFVYGHVDTSYNAAAVPSSPGALNDTDPATTVTFNPFGRYFLSLAGNYTAESIIGVRVEIDATGTGQLSWQFSFDEVGTGPGRGFFTVSTGLTGPPIAVSGPLTYVHEITGADVTGFTGGVGFSVEQMVTRAAESSYPHGYGRLESVSGSGSVVVSRFHVIAYTAPSLFLPAPARRHPRDDSGQAHSARRYPPPRSIQASARRAGGYY